ncbi:MAG: BrnT family toxin [Treponema sp.]|nr:BrnT family toxin [Treponema sp.]
MNAFVWDTEKNKRNKIKHGISFESAVRIFSDPCMTQQYDTKNSTVDEERWKCVGRDLVSGSFQTLTVSMTEHGEYKRIFSARKATVKEIKEYEAHAALL